MNEKKCTYCKEIVDISLFLTSRPSRPTKDGYQSLCKICRVKKNELVKDKKNKIRNKNREKNKEIINRNKRDFYKQKKRVETIVYHIYCNNTPVYVGITNNIEERQRQHNRSLKDNRNKFKIYEYLRFNNISSIELIPIIEFDTLTEAKRYEAYLILEDHFTKRNLKNGIPCISSRVSYINDKIN